VGRSGLAVLLLAVVLVAVFTVNTLSKGPKDLAGIPVGHRMPAFAAPLALSDLEGDVNVATAPDQGAAGKVPACSVRGPKVLNICQEWEHGPVVLALFVDGSACTGVLGEMQKLRAEFPQVRFVAVALKGEREPVRATIKHLHLTYPVGLDPDGILAELYALASCPQITFAYPGGDVQSRALLVTPSLDQLRKRVRELVAGSEQRAAGAAR